AAVAIPQYMKYQMNARLSNVQSFTKDLANLGIGLANTAIQNPNCTDETHFTLNFDSANKKIQVKNQDGYVCDEINVDLPSWVNGIDLTDAEVEITGTEVTVNGTIGVKSNYSLGSGKYIGCKCNTPGCDKLADLGDNYYCRTQTD
ncbi:hypothetical protein, partial [Thermodesulfatator indicus]